MKPLLDSASGEPSPYPRECSLSLSVGKSFLFSQSMLHIDLNCPTLSETGDQTSQLSVLSRLPLECFEAWFLCRY